MPSNLHTTHAENVFNWVWDSASGDWVKETQATGGGGGTGGDGAILDGVDASLKATVLAPVTAAAATDAPLVVALHPGSPLPFGSSQIGKVGQGTAGTVSGAWYVSHHPFSSWKTYQDFDNVLTTVNDQQTVGIEPGGSTVFLEVAGTHSGVALAFTIQTNGDPTPVLGVRTDTGIAESTSVLAANETASWMFSIPGFGTASGITGTFAATLTAITSGSVNTFAAESARPLTPISATTVSHSALPVGAATETTLASVNTKTPALGQAAMFASTPVVIASNQTGVPVTLPVPVTATGTFLAFSGNAVSLSSVSAMAVAYVKASVSSIVNQTVITFEASFDNGVNWVALRGTTRVPTTSALTAATATVTFASASAHEAYFTLPSGVTDIRVRDVSGSPGGATVTVFIGASPNAESLFPGVVQAGTWTATVTQPTGTNLHVVVDSAPTTAVTGPLTDVQLRTTAVPVSGPLTDTQLRASGIDISDRNARLIGSVANAFTLNSTATSGAQKTQVVDAGGVNLNLLTDAQLRASAVPVTANAGTNLNTSALALDATLTGRTQKTQLTDGTRDGTVKAASTLPALTDTAVVTTQRDPLPAGTNVIGHVIADSGSTTAVTGNVTVVQATGTNLHAVIDTGSTTTVTQATAANLNATVTQQTLTKGTQGATGVTTQDLKDAGRTSIAITATVASTATSETLISVNKSSGLGATGAGSSIGITTGKRLRIQAISISARNSTGTTASNVTVNLRAAVGGATTAASPLQMHFMVALPASAVSTLFPTILIPDGFEIDSNGATNTYGFTITHPQWVTGSVVATFDITLIGYEY